MTVRRKAWKKRKPQPYHHRETRGKRAIQHRMERAHYAPCVEPGCGGQGKPVTGDVMFPGDPRERSRLYYVCQCGAYVGASYGGHPAGYPGGPSTRFARARAHEALGAVVKTGYLSQQAAEAMIAEKMGIAPMRCSISRMGRLEAYRVTRLCEEVLGEAQRAIEAEHAITQQKEDQAERKADEAFKKTPPAFLGAAAS